MVWLASSVWRRRRVAYCGLGPPGWGVSIMTRLPSPGWSFGMPSGSARNCLQRNRPFRLSAAGAVIWRRLLVTPSFTARSYGRCASFLKATWSASSMESFLSWKPVLCAAMWYRGWTDRNIMCFSAYSAYACRDVDDEKEGTLRGWVFFFSDPGGILQTPNQSQNPVWEKETLFAGVWRKVGDCCALVSRGRSQPYFHFGHSRDLRILSYRKDVTTQPR